MKSKTLSYKKTLFLKNVTRFMPFWALYILCLLLGLAMLSGGEDRFYYAMNLAECARYMAIVNCAYGLLVAQLLFGDLYDIRMCNGIHSLPMRRDEIFLVNVLSGILFCLGPTAIMTIFALPLSLGDAVMHGWQIPFLWFGAANLQYLFFFGLAVFCAFCAGNRFSMAVIYGILNFGGLLLNLLISTLYLPMMPGVVNNQEFYQFFTPVIRIAFTPLLILRRDYPNTPGIFELQSSWGYLFGCAAVGIVLLALALLMYRKRALECAGEFIPIRALKPVFLVIFSMVSATGLHLVARIFFGFSKQNGLVMAFTFVGLIIGWFVALMLVEKSTRVFGKKTFLGLGILTGVMAVSLLAAHMDLFRVTGWVPDPQKVEYVTVIPSYDAFGRYWTDHENYRQKDPDMIEKVTEMHRLAVKEGLTSDDYYPYYYDEMEVRHGNKDSAPGRYTVPISLEYHMKNGAVRRRYYYVYADEAAGEIAKQIFSTEPYAVRGYEHLALRIPADRVTANGVTVPKKYLTREDTEKLLTAIQKDCAAGTLASMYEFHKVPVFNDKDDYNTLRSLYVSIHFVGDREIYLEVFPDSENTFKWFQQRGIVKKVIDSRMQ